MQVASYGTPVSERTPEVRDTIVAAITGVNNADDVTNEHLAEISRLNLNSKDLNTLKAGDFDGLTRLKVLRLNNNQLMSLPKGIFEGLTTLKTLNLHNNQLSSLPAGLFEGLTSITTLRLGANTVDPFPITVSLERVAAGQFKAVVPTGATFDYVIPFTVTNGTITGGTTTLTIPQGSMESNTLTVTRAPTTTEDVTVNTGTLPTPPANHFGYELVQSADLPLVIIEEINTVPMFTDGTATTRPLAENSPVNTNIGSPVSATDADNDSLTYTLGGTDATSFRIDTITGQLRTAAALDYETKPSYSVIVSVSDSNGGTNSITVTIEVTDVLDQDDPLYDRTQQVQDAIVARVPGVNDAADVTFAHLAAITSLNLSNQSINALKPGDFDGLTSLTRLDLSGNSISDISPLSGLTNLTQLYLSDNTLSDISDLSGLTKLLILHLDNNTLSDISPLSEMTNLTRLDLSENDSLSDISDLSRLTNLTRLDLSDNTISDISSLSGLTKLTHLYLDNNPISNYGPLHKLIEAIGGRLSHDINFPPEFTDGTSTSREVAENTEQGENIGDPVTATDADSNDTLTYTLGGVDAAAFDIVSSSGQLQTNAELDYETQSSYTVTVSVSDGNGGTDSIGVTITIIDVDENRAPEFTEGGSTSRSIAAGTQSGENIGVAFAAIDADSNDTLRYSLGGEDADLFDIDPISGQLTATMDDYDGSASYSVTVYVSDGNGGIDSIDVTITFIGITGNAHPTFNDGENTSGSVAENTGSGVNIGDPVSATDPDNADTLTYTLEGVDAAAFDIDSTDGQLRTKSTLDYETKSSYSVSVSVSDGNDGTDSIDVTITITDVNDAPLFADGDATTRTIAENTAADVHIGSAISASDPENDTLTYSLSGTDAASFDIVSSTGQLRTKAELDYETKTSYSVIVSVSDSNGETDSIDVTITITDVNEVPVFADGSRTTRTIVENTATGVHIGSAISASDPENDTLTYTLGGTNAAAFDIVSSSGQLLTNAELDYETKDAYSVTVSVSDGNGGTDSIDVTITITDVHENRLPAFTEGTSISRSIAENTGPSVNIGDPISATDPDNEDTLTYTLGGVEAAAFDIDSTDGQLRTKNPLDYETKASYSVSVSVSDGNGGTDSIDVTITITDVNEAPLFADGDTTTRTIAENTAAGIHIGSAISASDPENDTLTYSLSGTDAASFDIVSSSGQLQTKAALDYETKSSYSVIVSVSDSNGETDSITVTITITNVNEPPLFADGDTTTRTIAENTGSNVIFGAPVSATDMDTDDTLTYTLGGTDAAAFDLNLSTGQLQTKAALDYETQSSYSVSISVSDGNGGTDSIDVTITITDVNEPPVFADGDTTTRTIAENTAAGVHIGSVINASDPENDTLTYSLGGTDAASFDIVSNTGQLRTNATLDYETKSSYSVTVSVADGNGGTDSIDVTITIIDVNENRPPAFYRGIRSLSIAENTAPGVNIGDPVSATDPDTADTLTYTLGGVDAESFDIISSSGQLQTKTPLDYETKFVYSVTVSVSDGNGGSDSVTVTINVTDVWEQVYPLMGRTQQVQDAIVAAVNGVDSAAEVTEAHLAAIRSLDLNNQSITTLKSNDFNGLTNLTQLLLDDNSISNVFFLLGLTNLDTLSLQRNPISDISVLSRMTYLTYLNLHRNAISDISALSGLTNLAWLYLDGNSISDISALSGLTNLAWLYLDGNSISDISALSDMTNLQILSLDNNSVSDISALSRMTNLQTLALPNNSISDISHLSGLTNLTSLNLSNNSISDISTLSKFTNLTFLGLSYNPISDISALTTLTNLSTLTLSGNPISNYNPLRTLIAAIEAAGRSLDLDILIPPVGGNNRAPVFTDGTSTIRSVAENAASSENIGTPIAATDADSNDTLTYTLGGADAVSFDIISSSGQLRTEAALDYESKASHSVTVFVSDGNGGTDSITVNINVTDQPDPLDGRTQQVQDAIVEMVDGVDTAAEVTEAHLAAITWLYLNHQSITSLTPGDFDGLTNLELLDLYGNSISDISPLSGLTNLTTLSLGENSISDISSLSELTNLQELDLSGTSISDISALSGLTNLTFLQLFGTSISDISALSGLTNLTFLHLAGTSISDISALSRLTNLTELRLAVTSISDISALSRLTNLTELYLQYNSIRDISALSGLTNLTTLRLDNTSISDISALSELTNLTTLRLDDNSIEDISALSDMTELTTLRLDHNSITDTASLSEMKKLIYLNLNWNYVNDTTFLDLSGLSGLTNLETLWLHGNNIEDFGPLNILVAAIEADGRSIYISIPLPEAENNNKPVFIDGDSTSRSVAENTESGQNIGHAVTAVDGNVGDTLTYTLVGPDAESFDLDRSSGQLLTKAPLDYEAQSSYSVIISVSDGKRYGSDRINVAIHVTDVAEVAAAPKKESVSPTTSALLANYPNPFNPETWIPYQLAKPADVTLTIYAINGQVVRQLALGHQDAGVYQTRSRAAHWDGRNAFGEPVASGLYFYTLKAGEFTATRKMLIRK